MPSVISYHPDAWTGKMLVRSGMGLSTSSTPSSSSPSSTSVMCQVGYLSSNLTQTDRYKVGYLSSNLVSWTHLSSTRVTPGHVSMWRWTGSGIWSSTAAAKMFCLNDYQVYNCVTLCDNQVGVSSTREHDLNTMNQDVMSVNVSLDTCLPGHIIPRVLTWHICQLYKVCPQPPLPPIKPHPPTTKPHPPTTKPVNTKESVCSLLNKIEVKVSMNEIDFLHATSLHGYSQPALPAVKSITRRLSPRRLASKLYTITPGYPDLRNPLKLDKFQFKCNEDKHGLLQRDNYHGQHYPCHATGAKVRQLCTGPVHRQHDGGQCSNEHCNSRTAPQVSCEVLQMIKFGATIVNVITNNLVSGDSRLELFSIMEAR